MMIAIVATRWHKCDEKRNSKLNVTVFTANSKSYSYSYLMPDIDEWRQTQPWYQGRPGDLLQTHTWPQQLPNEQPQF